MEIDTSRRRFLELASAGTALSLAGCNGLTGAPDADADATPDVTADGTATVGVALMADQEELRRRQEEIQSDLEAGDVSRSEAQTQVRTAREELLSEAIASFSDRAGSNDALAVEGTVERLGLLLVSGSAAALVEALSFGEVSALVPEATFTRARSQANVPSATPTPSN